MRFEYLHQWAGGEVPMRLCLFPASRLNWNIHLETVLHDVWCEYRRGPITGNRAVQEWVIPRLFLGYLKYQP